jgi:hypothetical protein
MDITIFGIFYRWQFAYQNFDKQENWFFRIGIILNGNRHYKEWMVKRHERIQSQGFQSSHTTDSLP